MKRRILFIVDCQNDFFENGALAVSNSNEIIPVINELILKDKFDSIIVSKDWHPEDHSSFAITHGKEPFTEIDGEIRWPVHCVAGTEGAKIHKDIVIPIDMANNVHSIFKGTSKEKEEYSAVTKKVVHIVKDCDVVVVGLATDYCVRATVLDLEEKTSNTTIYVCLAACRGVQEETTKKAVNEMLSGGVYEL